MPVDGFFHESRRIERCSCFEDDSILSTATKQINDIRGYLAAIRHITVETSSVPGMPSRRRYSWVRIERKRGATAGSHGICSERQRSTATRRSRRKATQAGHASI